MTAAHDALALVLEPGQDIVIGQAYGTPWSLIEALPAHRKRLHGSRIFVGMLVGDAFPELPGTAISTFFPSGPLGSEEALRRHDVHYTRQSVHDLARGFRTGSLPVDVVLAQATPEHGGRHSLGVSVDYLAPAIARAERTVLEVDPTVPWTGVTSTIEADEHRVIGVETGCRPIVVPPPPPASARDDRIGDHVDAWIPDGATLQLGLGKWVGRLAARLEGRRNLRIHTGLVGDWLMALDRAGALDPSAPIFATNAGGSPAFYEWLDGRPQVRLAPGDFTHDVDRLRRLPAFRAVNSALEVDLLGQANSEIGHGGRRGGIGGLHDFATGAARNEDGLSILVLPSTTAGVSRIVPALDGERASLPPDAVDVVITEHGSADLRERSAPERARALLRVAAPEHRDELERSARQLELL